MTPAELVARAESAYADYPQFRGSWDGWIVATVTRRFYRFGRTFFDRGDVVLVSPENIPGWPEDARLAYSEREKLNVTIPTRYLEGLPR